MQIERIGRTNEPAPLMAHAVNGRGIARMCFTPWEPDPTLEGQVQQVFDRLDEYLAKSGTNKSRLLTAEVWLRDVSDYNRFVPLWNAWVDPENPPVFAFSEAKLGRDTVMVEIKVSAAIY